MRKFLGRTLALAGALTLSTVGVSATAAQPAHATPDQCDEWWVADYYREVGSGVSFTWRGRDVRVKNGTQRHRTVAFITSGRQAGDAIWVDRSINQFPVGYEPHVFGPEHTWRVEERGGWKQCGPFFRITGATDMVWNNDFAVRACIRPAGANESHCGNWYIDKD